MAEYTLPPLPYDYAALEPNIDAKTMEIHHTKHHQAYITNLNNALKDHAGLQGKTIEDLISHLDAVPETIRTAGAQQRRRARQPFLVLADHEIRRWRRAVRGSRPGHHGRTGWVSSVQGSFGKAALGRFGSGWAWLIVGKDGKLAVTSTPNQDSPIMDGNTPLLGVDVWEHAYYLKYQNRRADYIAAWWNTLNWDEIGHRYKAAKK